MKEATGELNMTVITVVAIAAVGALLYAFVWPALQQQIANNTCKTYGPEYKAIPVEENVGGTKANSYKCCPEGTTSGSKCFTATGTDTSESE